MPVQHRPQGTDLPQVILLFQKLQQSCIPCLGKSLLNWILKFN